MMRKNLLPILGVLVMVSALAGALLNIGDKQDPRSSAAETPDRVDVILETASSNVSPGSQVTVNLVLDSQLHVSGIDFTLEFDPAKLRPVSLTNAGALTDVLEIPNIGSNTMSAAFGAVRGSSLQGRGTVAVAVFEVIGQGSTEIRVKTNGTTEPMATASEFLEGEVNRTNFAGMDPLQLSISSGGNQSNSPPPGRLRGDCNSDNRASLIDFAEVVRTFNQNVAANSGCDFDGDGRISLPDFNAIVAAITVQLTGGAPVPQPTTPPVAGLEFEAESGQISAPFQVQDGRLFQSVTNTGGIANNGEAHYTVTIPQTGNYIVQGLVCAADIDSNSFYVKFDSHPSGNSESWILTPTGSSSTCNWQTVNHRGTGGAESPSINPVVFPLSQGPHELHFHGREKNTYIDKFRITSAGSTVPTNAPQPTSVPQATNVPQPTLVPSIVATIFPTTIFPSSTPFPPGTGGLLPPPIVVETSDPAGANEWCGRYPNCTNGCVGVSSQGWTSNNPNAGAHLTQHEHSEWCAPVWRGTGRFYVPPNMDMPVRVVMYNQYENGQAENFCTGSNWIRNQWQGNTYSQKNYCMHNTQTSENQRLEFRHTVVLKMDVTKGGGGVNEARVSPNSIHPIEGRHFTSSNAQIDTGISPNGVYGFVAGSNPPGLYRGSNPACSNPTNKATNFMTRYWIAGDYHRTAFLNAGCLIPPNSSRALLTGTVALGFEVSGQKGDCKASLYLSPAFHRHDQAAAHLSNPIFENHACGTFVYNFDSRTKPDGLYGLVLVGKEIDGGRQTVSVTKLETVIDNN